MRVQEDLLAKEAPPPPTGRRSSLGRARFGLGLVEWLEAASREGRTQSRRPHARQTASGGHALVVLGSLGLPVVESFRGAQLDAEGAEGAEPHPPSKTPTGPPAPFPRSKYRAAHRPCRPCRPNLELITSCTPHKDQLPVTGYPSSNNQ